MNESDRPIGVFDSGIGGLTVVRALREQLPDESILYFGDTARVPYGAKSPDTVARYSAEAAAFLRSRGVKLIVIACNTATAHAWALLSSTMDVPVVGVIEPGSRAAVEASRTGRIGVIGTAGTIRSGAYDLAVRRRLDTARVYAQPCPLFVPLVEEGMNEAPATRLIAADYLRPLRDMDVDVLILGCTHYPLLRPVIQQEMGDDVMLVDSALQTAIDVRRLLDEKGLRADGSKPATWSFVASDSPLRFREIGRHFVGDLITTVEHVDVEAWGRVRTPQATS